MNSTVLVLRNRLDIYEFLTCRILLFTFKLISFYFVVYIDIYCIVPQGLFRYVYLEIPTTVCVNISLGKIFSNHLPLVMEFVKQGLDFCVLVVG